MAKKTVGDLLIDRLIAWGVDTVFGYPGDGVNGIFEALRTRQERIKFIQVLARRSCRFRRLWITTRNTPDA